MYKIQILNKIFPCGLSLLPYDRYEAAYEITNPDKNIPKIVGQITKVLANENINIEEMLNRHHGDIAYNIINVNQGITKKQIEAIKALKE